MPYQAPLLLEQNRKLLAENQEMAIIIHQKHIATEALENKLRVNLAG